MTLIKPAPVRRILTVRSSPQRAFDVFTRAAAAWWPKSHSTGRSPLAEIVLEPQIGERWYERGEDGSIAQWGRVLAWDPPHRLLLAWQLTADWKFDPDFITEIEIRFDAAGEGLTRIEFEHRDLERFADKAETIRAMLDAPGGWAGILESFVKQAEAS